MTGYSRTLIGIGVGAVATLLIHPVSRAVILGPMRAISAENAAATLDSNPDRLPPPSTRERASAWIQEACERIRSGHSLSNSELTTVLGIAEAGGKRESENAYWFQMQAVFASQMKNRDRALRAWTRSAACLTYNDFQSTQLLASRAALGSLSGRDSAWQYAYVYPKRSDSCALLTEQFARSVIADTDYDSLDGIRMRYVTIVNADLLRIGSRWMPITSRASDLVELATYPADLMTKQTPKNLHLGKVRLLDSLRRHQMVTEYARIDHALNDSEAWRYMILREASEEMVQFNTLRACAIGTIPTSLFCTAVIGACVLIGHALLQAFPLKNAFTLPVIAAVALISGLAMYGISGYWLSALTLSLSVLFLSASPKNLRSHPPSDIGPLYRLTTFSLSAVMALGITAYVACLLTPTRLLFPVVYPGFEIDSVRNAIGGAIGLTLCIYLLCNPLWAFVVRIGTPYLIRLSLLRLGAYLSVGCLAGTIIATVIVVPSDRDLSSTWAKIVANEPNFYLTR